ncbi:MAG TPA: MFS transporter [Candidatus Saccharimonadales bacterium]
MQLDIHHQNTRTFMHLLSNTLFVSVINFTVWFAITFYTYIQTKSVFATGIIAGIFLVLTATSGIWFGSLVDHHKKKTMMQLSSAISLTLYSIALVVYSVADKAVFKDPTNPVLWVFIVLLMSAVIAGNIRTIAMPTLTTLLIAEDRRDKANGLVGSANGVSFLVTSAISGLLVAWNGMYGVLALAVVILAASIVHLWFINVPVKEVVHVEGQAPPSKNVDIRGTINLVRGVPGLMALIFFSTFNNFLGGVFMALMDAYGLELMSVRAWGLLWAVLSTGFIFGGLIIAKTGLGKNPLRTLLLVNVIMWSITILFPLQASIWFLAGGMLVYMYLIPYAEAAEQTILQRVVPYERQGRVFGFAQSVEQSASPITAFAISPLAQFVFIPFMTTGAGVGLIGDWFGTGVNRGIALSSKFYRQLTARYQQKDDDTQAAPPTPTEAMQGGLV